MVAKISGGPWQRGAQVETALVKGKARGAWGGKGSCIPQETKMSTVETSGVKLAEVLDVPWVLDRDVV